MRDLFENIMAVILGAPPKAPTRERGSRFHIVYFIAIIVTLFFFYAKYQQEPSSLFISPGLCKIGLRNACSSDIRRGSFKDSDPSPVTSACLPKRPNLSGPKVMDRSVSSVEPVTHRVRAHPRRAVFRDGNSANHWEIGELSPGSCVQVLSETRFWSEIVIQDCDSPKTYYTESVNLQKFRKGEQC